MNKKYRNLEKIDVFGLLTKEINLPYDTNKKLTEEEVNFPEFSDLESLTKIVTKTSRTTIMEFGCGWSSLIFAKALNHNKSKFDFYAFSLGPEVNDDWNSEVKKCFNKLDSYI